MPQPPSGSEDAVIAILEKLYARDPSSFLAGWCRAGYRCTDSHLGNHLFCALTLLSQTVPSYVHLPGVNQNLYTLLIAKSGERKTTAITYLQKVAKMIGLQSVSHVEPGSPQALIQSLTDLGDGGSRLITYPEFGDFLDQSDPRKKGPLSTIRSTYMKAFDGAPLGTQLVHRTTHDGREAGGVTEVENYRLCLIGAAADDLLLTHTMTSDWTGGFLARFLVFYDARVRRYPQQGDVAVHFASMVEWLQRRLAVPALVITSGVSVQMPDTTHGGFSPEAKERYDRWFCDDQNPWERTRNSARQAAGNRMPDLVQRLAFLVSWDINPAFSGGQPWWIEMDALDIAIDIAMLHWRSFEKIESRFCETDREERVVERLSELLRDADDHGHGLTMSEISRALKKSGRQILDAIHTLKVRGDVTERFEQRPTGVFKVVCLKEGTAVNRPATAAPPPEGNVYTLPLPQAPSPSGSAGGSNGNDSD